MQKVAYLFGEPSAHALEVLLRNFDIADVTVDESRESIAYTQSRIDVARESIKSITDRKERRMYEDWLTFFQLKVDDALASKHQKPQ